MTKYYLAIIMIGALLGLIMFASMLLRTRIRASESKHKHAWDIALSAGASLISCLLFFFMYEYLLYDLLKAALPDKPALWLTLVCLIVPAVLFGILPCITILPKWNRLPEEKPEEYIDTGAEHISTDDMDSKREFLNKL